MKQHIIELKDFQDWLAEEEKVYANSYPEKKQLACTMNGTLKVYHNGEVVYQGTQPFSAVEKYNSI